MEAPSCVLSFSSLCQARLPSLVLFLIIRSFSPPVFFSLLLRSPLFSISFFLFVLPCSLFLSSSLLPLLPSCTVFALFFFKKNPPYSQRMSCGYPDNKELMGLLLQKFEILQKVTLCMCNNTGRAFNTSITAIGPLPPPPPLSS